MGSLKHLRPLKDFVLVDSADQPDKKSHQPWHQFAQDIHNKLGACVHDLHPYEKVNVMLLCWETSDSNNLSDCSEFSKFLREEFNYDTEILQVKGDAYKPDRKGLNKGLRPLLDKSSPTSLTIFFYSGHGWSNATSPAPNTRKDCILFPRAATQNDLGFNPNTTDFGVAFSDIIHSLIGLEGSILVLLDCCSGGGAAIDGISEILAASCAGDSGKRNPGNVPSSRFFAALMQSMKELKDSMQGFTAAQLFANIATEALNFQPPFDSASVLYSFGSQRQIIFKANHSQKRTKVLLCISLEGGQPEISEFFKWFRSLDRPSSISSIEVVGFLAGSSTELLVAVPLTLWATLPNHPAYTFSMSERGTCSCPGAEEKGHGNSGELGGRISGPGYSAKLKRSQATFPLRERSGRIGSSAEKGAIQCRSRAERKCEARHGAGRGRESGSKEREESR